MLFQYMLVICLHTYMISCIDHINTVRRNGVGGKNYVLLLFSTVSRKFKPADVDLLVFSLSLFSFTLFLTQMHLLWTSRFSTSAIFFFFLLVASRALSLLFLCYQPQQKPYASVALLQIISLSTTAFLNSHCHHCPGTADIESTSAGFNARKTVLLTPNGWINVT